MTKKNAFVLSLPGLLFSIACCIPCIVFCIMNKSKLPPVCASHFDASGLPNGYQDRNTFFWFSVLLPAGITLFVDAIGLLITLLPASAYNGIDPEYLKKGNNLNIIRSKMLNMLSMLGSLLAVFFFSVFEPNWEYNWKCKIDPEHPVPCEYKIVVLPQVLVFIVLELAIITVFTMSLKKKLKNQGLLDEDEQHYWKCGCCYINDNDERLCVPNRLGGGWTVNLGNPLGVSLLLILILCPIVGFGLVVL
ncbi:hypothetical protein WA556_003920, partial [Blastocystis sp. ATCC 50177/Nand II]